MKKTVAKQCNRCNGNGIILALHSDVDGTGTKIVLSRPYCMPCPSCWGSGIGGIPELETLTLEQMAKITEGRTFEELFDLFNHRTKAELEQIIAVFSKA